MMSRQLVAFLAVLWVVAGFYFTSPMVYSYFEAASTGYSAFPEFLKHTPAADLTAKAVAWYNKR